MKNKCIRVITKVLLSFTIFSIPFMNIDLVRASESLPEEAKETLKDFIYYLSTGDDEVYRYILSSNKNLSSAVEGHLSRIQIQYFIKKVEQINDSVYQVYVVIQASGYDKGVTWNMNGIPVMFELKKENEKYFVSQTDLFDKVGSNSVFSMILKIFLLLGGIFFIYGLLIIGIVLFIIKRNKKKIQKENYV